MKAGTERAIVSVVREGTEWRWKAQYRSRVGEVGSLTGTHSTKAGAWNAAFASAEQMTNEPCLSG